MRHRHLGLLLVPLSLFAVGLLAACGSVAASGSAQSPSSGGLPFPDTGSRLGSQPGTQVITFKVVGSDQGAVGPDGRHHDTFRPTSSTTVAAGRPVTVEIVNEDDMPHSFTLPQLGIDRMVPAARSGKAGQVTFTFTPPGSGTYRWYCALPCDQDNGGWAMGMTRSGHMGMGTGMMEPGVDGFMAGYLTATS